MIGLVLNQELSLKGLLLVNHRKTYKTDRMHDILADHKICSHEALWIFFAGTWLPGVNRKPKRC